MCNCTSKKKLAPTIRKTKSVVKTPANTDHSVLKPTRRIRRRGTR